MKITSPVFENNKPIPKKYSCDGDNINPSLEIFGVPKGAKSLVLIMDDPDAPIGTFIHWVIFNINPLTSLIEENSVPKNAIEGLNSAKKHSYLGPCPPSGIHHYYFKLYALDMMLNLDSSSDKADVEKSMEGHILEAANLIGTYERW